MRPDLTIVLDEALERLRAGATVEECLRAYPEHAADLEPMLRTAAAIRRQAAAALPPSLEQWLASGRGEIEQIARATYARRETATQRFMRQASAYVARLLKRSGPRMASAALTVVVILFMTFYTVDGAAARSLPGDYLYRWKLFSEQARIAITVDPDRRAQLVAASVERRVAEITALTESGQASPALIAETVAQLESQVDQALTALPEASSATNERTTAYIGRLLARAESDLREASAPDQGGAHVIETAAASVAGMIDVLPAQADAQRPPTAEAAAPPAGDTTPAATPQPSQSQSGPSAPTAPPIVIVGPPAGGGIPAPVPTPEPGILENTPAPTPTPTANEGGQVVIIPAPPTFTPAPPTPTFTPQPTRTPQATRTPVITSAPPEEPSSTSRPVQPQTPTATLPVISSPTPEATATDEPTATASNTATPTSTPTATDEPTATATRTPTRTPTSTPTDTPTPTDTATPTSTPTDTATPTSTPTDTATPTSTPTDTATPSPTPTTIGDDPISGALRPLLECVTAQPDGTYLAVFGYRNNTGDMAIADIGIDNYFYPGLIDRGQPTVFSPGRSSPFPNIYFSVAFDGAPLTWVLGRHEVTATRDTRACPTPTPTTDLAP